MKVREILSIIGLCFLLFSVIVYKRFFLMISIILLSVSQLLTDISNEPFDCPNPLFGLTSNYDTGIGCPLFDGVCNKCNSENIINPDSKQYNGEKNSVVFSNHCWSECCDENETWCNTVSNGEEALKKCYKDRGCPYIPPP